MAGAPVGIKVEGVRETLGHLRRLGDKDTPKAIRAANLEAAREVVPEAKRRAPKRSGRLARSIRATATQRAGKLQAGSRVRVPYAGPIHFGWFRRHIRPQPFLYSALDARRGEVERAYEQAIAKVVSRFNA